MELDLSPSSSLLDRSRQSGAGATNTVNPFTKTEPATSRPQVNPFSGGVVKTPSDAQPFKPQFSTISVVERTSLTLVSFGFAADQPDRLLYTSPPQGTSVVCFCVLDENDGQEPNDRPSFFRQTMIETFPEFGADIKHITINFLPEQGDLSLLEPVDNENTFLFRQPRVDGYDWYSRIDELVGPLDPSNTLMLFCIDESGSMDKSNVVESLAIFADRTRNFEIPPIDVTMDPNENMFLPFLREDVLTLMGEQYDLLS